MQNTKRKLAAEYLMAIGGALIFSFGLNVFIMPYGLLSANFTGVAQILRELIMNHSGLPIPESFNLTGVIFGAFNVPLILLAYKQMSRHFLIKTVVAAAANTLAISVIPIPPAPLLDSVLTSSIIGGIVTGFGAGLTLRSGGSGGGVDILGILATKRNPNFSVGKISIMVGAVVLLYALLRHDLNLVVYSTIYTVIMAFALDKVHYQTIKTGAMIFSKDDAAQKFITGTFGRGATCWKGYGAYTGSELYISYSVISKSEAVRLKRELRNFAPGTFVVFTDGMDVMGNYESHL